MMSEAQTKEPELDLANVAQDSKRRPILVLDFDGVLHSYASGWQGVDQIPDRPVSGFAEFLERAVEKFAVAVHSSRSRESRGRAAMQDWLFVQLAQHFERDSEGLIAAQQRATEVMCRITFPAFKPPAFITIDDRAITFNGCWPDPELLLEFRPWYVEAT